MANTNRPNKGTLITVYRAVVLVLIIAIAAGTLLIATRETSPSCVSAEVRTSQGDVFEKGGKLVTAEGVVWLNEQDPTVFTLEKGDQSNIKGGRVVYEHSTAITPTILDFERRLEEVNGRKAQVVYYDNGEIRLLVAWYPTGA